MTRVDAERISQRIETLEKLLKDPDEGVRQKAAESLSRVEAMVDFDAYVSTLDNDNRAVKIQAIYLLAELATESAIELLRSQMSNPYDDVRAAVIKAFRDSSDNYRIAEVCKKAVDVILMGLEDLDWSIRTSAADTLGKFKDPRSAAPLLAMMKGMVGHESEDIQLIVSIILALGEIGDRDAVPDIIKKAETDEFEIKEAALKVLGLLGDARAQDCLIESLTSDNAEIRMQAAESLGRI